jgi:hypothetical protein
VLAHYEDGLFVKWLNDGAAPFSEGERIVRHEATQALVVDVDGDGPRNWPHAFGLRGEGALDNGADFPF